MKLRNPLRILLLLVGLAVFAQSPAQGPPKKADKLYAEGAYLEAARLYQRYLRGQESLDAQVKLARAYRAAGELEKAEAEYAKVVFHPQSTPEHKFEFGKLLKARGNYPSAKAWFLKYAEQSPDSSLGMRWARSCDAAKRILADSLSYIVRYIPSGNSKYSELGPMWYKNGILFASNRPRGFLVRFFNGSSKTAFYDLYFSEVEADGRLKKPVYQRDNLNTRFHDGPISLPGAEHIAFVTRSNMEGLGTGRDAAGYSRVTIYRIDNHLGRWRKGNVMPFSSQEYNIAHPAVSHDGGTLIFASDMPGGFGGTDLYWSKFVNNGWTRPENLGPEVNTEANEGYPYISNDSTLYFTSDRAEGLGGKDVFSATRRGGKWTYIRNLGYPLNTPHDDFGFCISPTKAVGFFCSNRPGGKGDDDIWTFRRYKSVDAVFVDAYTEQPLEGVRVEVTDINQKVVTYKTGPDGRVRHTLRTGQEVFVTAGMEGYSDYKGTVSLRSTNNDRDLYLRVPLVGDNRFAVEGTVTDASTKAPLQDALVRVIGETDERRYADEKGNYSVDIAPGETYQVLVHTPGYIPLLHNFTSAAEGEGMRTYHYDAALKKGSYVFVEGQAVDSETQLPLAAKVRIFDGNGRDIKSFETRPDGLFWQILDEGKAYSILATRGEYFAAREELERDSLVSDTVSVKLRMVRLEPGKVFKIIYYEYAKSDIGGGGQRDLQELGFVLQDNPGISVELSSHTDARGSADFNKKLSQKRADQAAAYLMTVGIPEARIKAVGYGESQLFNNCGDGVKCTEELHAQNRRTEIRVVKIDVEKQEQ